MATDLGNLGLLNVLLGPIMIIIVYPLIVKHSWGQAYNCDRQCDNESQFITYSRW